MSAWGPVLLIILGVLVWLVPAFLDHVAAEHATPDRPEHDAAWERLPKQRDGGAS